MSWVHFPPQPRIVVTSHNRDFYAKEKKVLRECSFHSMKMKEGNEKTFCWKEALFLFSLEGSQRKIMRISQGHDVPFRSNLPCLKSTNSHTDTFYVIP